MSDQSWLDEFYPVPVKDLDTSSMSNKSLILHSIKKWEGALPENLSRHDLTRPPIYFDAETCALCKCHYINTHNCPSCPLSKIRNGLTCDQRNPDGSGTPPYLYWYRGKDPKPMLSLLHQALAKEELVELAEPGPSPKPGLDEFTLAYIEAALFTHGLSEFGVDDISPETLSLMISDCAKFQSENDLPEPIRLPSMDCSALALAGHDFWLTRNGHGSGFWDGDWPEPHATQLTQASKAFGEFPLFITIFHR